MDKYAIYFSKDKVKIRLPINPEELEITSTQANEKFEILKLGQIVIPTYMALREFSFEAELPHEEFHYVETGKNFETAEYYLDLFQKWREKQEPVRFMAGKISGDYKVTGDAINTLVLLESLTITEKAGEEHDKYVSFRLLEYNKFTKKYITQSENSENPKSTGYYVVKSGDTLWAIAKKYYGAGNKYTKIYNANKNIISNPSLIYPGQKLVIPS